MPDRGGARARPCQFTIEGGVSRSPGPGISTEPETQPPADVVLLATKAGDTESAAPWLTALVRADTVVVVAQNGIGHERRVAPLVGDATIVPALVYLAVERVEPGQLVWHSGRDIVLPSGPVAESVASVFSGTNHRTASR